MKQVRGIWIPDSDEHFVKMIGAPLFEGKGTYQYQKLQAAMPFCKGFDHALDIGGHVGLWSRVLGRRFNRVTAFEPLPPHIECFERNVPMFPFPAPSELDAAGYPNVDLLKTALGAQFATLTIQMPNDNTGHAHTLKGPGSDSTTAWQVPCVTLDSMIDALGPQIDFIKIDVEGFELEVIKGGEALIRKYRPAMVVEQKANNAERYGAGQWDAVRLLKDWGAVERTVMAGDHILSW